MWKMLEILILCAAALVTAAPADPSITASAILPRQNGGNFIGWYSSGGYWFSSTCSSGMTWAEGGSRAQCCWTTFSTCNFATYCSNALIWYSGESAPVLCSTYSDAYDACATNYYYSDEDDSSPQIQFYCATADERFVFYKNLPATSTPVPSTPEPVFPTPQTLYTPLRTSLAPLSTTSRQITTSGLGTGVQTLVVSTVIVSTVIRATPNDSQNQQSAEKSDTWIAGAVIGPVSGLALIGAFFWFFLHRRRRNQVVPQQSIVLTTPPNYTDKGPTSGYQHQPLFGGSASDRQQSPTVAHDPKYDIPSPYSPSTSPIHQQAVHEVDATYGHMPSSPVQGSELSGATYGSGMLPQAVGPPMAFEMGHDQRYGGGRY